MADYGVLGRFLYQQTPQGAVTGRAPRDDALRGELGWLGRPDGRVSTELSMTESDPRLMNGAWVNMPLLVHGQVDIPSLLSGTEPSPQQREIAILRAIQRLNQGAMLPSYGSLDDALRAAESRPASIKLPYFRGML